jgi:hypothetical protein
MGNILILTPMNSPGGRDYLPIPVRTREPPGVAGEVARLARVFFQPDDVEVRIGRATGKDDPPHAGVVVHDLVGVTAAVERNLALRCHILVRIARLAEERRDLARSHAERDGGEGALHADRSRKGCGGGLMAQPIRTPSPMAIQVRMAPSATCSRTPPSTRRGVRHLTLCNADELSYVFGPMLEQKIKEMFGDEDPTGFGTGWWSGVLSAFFGVLAFGAVVCLHFPQVLSSPELRPHYPMAVIRILIQVAIVAAIILGVVSAFLRRKKILGLTGMLFALAATLLGGASVPINETLHDGPAIGLDWFLLDMLLMTLIFSPIEVLWPAYPMQSIFRPEWLLDVVYFLSTHLPIRITSFLVLLPATQLTHFPRQRRPARP